MQIGYARVSTRDQNLALQLDALKAAGCKPIFEDKVSGATRSRPGLEKTLATLEQGDTLVVWKLDRLGRTVKQLVEFVGDLQQRGIEFRSLTDGIDTSTPGGRFFFHVMAGLAEMEHELIRERTRAGLDSARERGLVGGRKPKLDETKIDMARAGLASGKTPKVVAKSLGVSVATLYRHIPAAASIAGQP